MHLRVEIVIQSDDLGALPRAGLPPEDDLGPFGLKQLSQAETDWWLPLDVQLLQLIGCQRPVWVER